MTGKPALTDDDFRAAARKLGCAVAAIKAVAEVESRGAGFLASGAPKILFEPHIFSRMTGHRYDKSHPDISYPKWKPGAYGPESKQHAKLQKAAELDRSAALQSCSWGKFQIMGFNWQLCGYASLQAFISAMYRSEGDHLDAFVGYVIGRKLDDELRDLRWDAFANGYNGPGYKENAYDTKMERAYAKYAKEPDFSRVRSSVTSTEDTVDG